MCNVVLILKRFWEEIIYINRSDELINSVPNAIRCKFMYFNNEQIKYVLKCCNIYIFIYSWPWFRFSWVRTHQIYSKGILKLKIIVRFFCSTRRWSHIHIGARRAGMLCCTNLFTVCHFFEKFLFARRSGPDVCCSVFLSIFVVL